MNTELHKKILADLQKAGIGSELRVIQTLKQRNWRLFVSPSFYDRDSDCSREIDIIAWHPIVKYEGDMKVSLRSFLQICLEVKKSETPWVVCAPKPDPEYVPVLRSSFLTLPHWLLDEQDERFKINEYWQALVDADYVTDIDWLGTNIHESFKSPTNASRWYGSFCAVSKAIQAEYEKEKSRYDQRHAQDTPVDSQLRDTHLFLGAVVLDGPLYAARLTDAGEIDLSEVPYAPFDFHMHSAKYQPADYRLDVVQINSLEAYLGMLEAWHDSFIVGVEKYIAPK